MNFEIIKLKNLTTKIGSGITPRGGESTYKNNGIPLIRSQNVLINRLDMSGVVYIDEKQHSKMSGSVVRPNDVLLNITGASIGRSCVVPSSLNEANVNQHVCIIRLKNNADPIYISTFLNSCLGQKQILSFQGGGSREGLNYQQIGSFDIHLPPFPEQKAIVDVLSAWDTAIEKTENLIKTKGKRFRWLLNKLIKQGSVKDEWRSVKLGEVFKLGRGRVINKEELENNPGIYPVYSSQTANNGIFGSINSYDFEGKYVTWTTDGANAGTVSYRSGKFNCTNVCGTAKPIDDDVVDCCFTAYQVDLHAKKYVSYIGNPKLMNNVFAEIPILIPSLSKQKQIAETLNTARAEINKLKQLAEKHKEQKRGLMQKLLTGQWRIEKQ